MIRDFSGCVCRLDASLTLGTGLSALRREDLLAVEPFWRFVNEQWNILLTGFWLEK